MPANIETMMYTGLTPWHRRGVRLQNAATAAEAIRAAELDWEVQLQPIFTGPDRTIRVKNRFVNCRMDKLDQFDGGQLGVVGRDYRPLQNRDAFSFLDPVVGSEAAIYHTAGSIRHGRQVWMLAKLPGEIRVVGDDIAEKYILLSNSHDGSSAVRIGLTPIRVVCQNTLNLALRGMSGLTIRHESNVTERVKEAHRLLGIINTKMDYAGSVMQNMARVSMNKSRMAEYFSAVMPLPDEDKVHQKKVKQHHNRWEELSETGAGNTLPGVRGSLWAAYNAVTQWVDRESYSARQCEPLRNIWFGNGVRIKHRAFAEAERLTAASNN